MLWMAGGKRVVDLRLCWLGVSPCESEAGGKGFTAQELFCCAPLAWLVHIIFIVFSLHK